MDHRVWLSYVRCRRCVCVSIEARSGVAQVCRVAAFFLRKPDALLRRHCNTAVCSTMSWVITASNPILSLQIVDMHVV